jgi:transmembrane sensor
MEKEIFIQLIKRTQEGTATAEEHRLVNEFYQRLEEEGAVQLSPEEEAAVGQRMLHNIERTLQEGEQPVVLVPGKNKSWWRYAAAAAMMGIVAGGYLLIQKRTPVTKEAGIAKQLPEQVPGYNKATLTLADGKVIPLDSMNNQVIQEGDVTAYQQQGALEYKASGKGATVSFNTLATPRGAQYRLMLPDGTAVWLNAESELKFPTSFPGKERRVTLKGEAYFEIAANAQQPFVVTANDVVVNVLGTRFNVMAYKDESFVRTTLLQGAVKVSQADDAVVLSPGQAATLRNDGTDIQVEQANTTEAIAWKNGYFVFNNENLESIMKKIVRYYNVEVEFRTDSKNKNFGGSVARFSSLADLLETLELTGIVHFKIDGNKVVVMP